MNPGSVIGKAEKRENSPRVRTRDGYLSCEPVEASGLAEREPVYELAHHLAQLANVTIAGTSGARRDELARLYGRSRPNARALFALLLDAAGQVQRSEPDARMSVFCAMANMPEIMTWDATERREGARLYWPDRRAYEKWKRGAKVLAARGGPRCAICDTAFSDTHLLGPTGRRSSRSYCDACMPLSEPERDDSAARSLLDAVCAVVPGERREYDRRLRWRGVGG